MPFREAIYPFDTKYFAEAMLGHLSCYQSISSRVLYRVGHKVKTVALGCRIVLEGVSDPSMVKRMRNWALRDSFTRTVQNPKESLRLTSRGTYQPEDSFREQGLSVARYDVFGTRESHTITIDDFEVDSFTDPLADMTNDSASCLSTSQILEPLDVDAVFQRFGHSNNEPIAAYADCFDTATKMWKENGEHTQINEECHPKPWGALTPRDVFTIANLQPKDWFKPNEPDESPDITFPSLIPNDMSPAGAFDSPTANDTSAEIPFLSPNGNIDNRARNTVPPAGLRQGLETDGLVNNVTQIHVINKLRADLRRERNRTSAFRCNEKKRVNSR